MFHKILIIDDSKIDQMVEEKHLRNAGYSEISFANSGEEGVALAAELKPDLVITDTMMPGIDGFTVCRQVKQLPGARTKVVIMTGTIDAVDALAAKQAGADEYCVKTADGQQLLDAIERIK